LGGGGGTAALCIVGAYGGPGIGGSASALELFAAIIAATKTKANARLFIFFLKPAILDGT
jgi:hypothetical protein